MDTTLFFDALHAPIVDEKPWAAFAACAGGHGMTFFPQTKKQEAEALAICAICPVREECLAHAIAVDERFGVWGGTTEKQRRHLRSITS